MAKQIALGKAVAAKAAKNKKFGKAIDKVPHHSGARESMAKGHESKHKSARSPQSGY